MSTLTPGSCIRWLLLTLLALVGGGYAWADSVNISIPASLAFDVRRVTATTTATPNPLTLSFTNGAMVNGNALRISLRASAINFTPPSGTVTIPADLVSWTKSNPLGGTANDGTVSAFAFTQVYQSNPCVGPPLSGSVDLIFRLGPPGANGLRAGNHSLTVQWKIEAITP